MNRVTSLFNIKYPIISGGMVWVSGGKLAGHVSKAGALGLIGAGSMKPELLKEHITKAQNITQNPIGINIPILYGEAKNQMDLALSLGVKIFFTSAGSPNKYTKYLKDQNAIVVHVTSSPELAKKCEDAGVDAVVCEGFEAGGHNGREELTSFCLIPAVKGAVKIPIIAAGGIYDAKTMMASMILGAEGIQMGTRFLMTHESSAHEKFKDYILSNTHSSSTKLLMKSTVPVRLFQNQFSKEIEKIESLYNGDELKSKLTEHLGKNRAKSGMLLGDINEGELEVGQNILNIKNIMTVQDLISKMMNEFQNLKNQIPNI